MEEKKLLKKLRLGQQEAYRFIFEKYYEWLCNYLLKLTGDRQLSEDLVQECLLNIWDKRKTLIISTSIKNYLFRSCHNQFLMHLRKEKKNKVLLDEIRWTTVFEVYQENLSRQQKEAQITKLNALLEALPPRCREVFVRGKLHELRYKDIAEEMGVSVKTVENQMAKAMNFLREHAHMFML